MVTVRWGKLCVCEGLRVRVSSNCIGEVSKGRVQSILTKAGNGVNVSKKSMSPKRSNDH